MSVKLYVFFKNVQCTGFIWLFFESLLLLANFVLANYMLKDPHLQPHEMKDVAQKMSKALFTQFCPRLPSDFSY